MPRILAWLLLLLWLQFFYAIHCWWEVDGSYYEFGWVVPPAAFWLFRQRSLALPLDRPAPRAGRMSLAWILTGCVVLACVVLLRFVERSYLFWRFPIWVHALLVVAVHQGLLARYRYPAGFAWVTLFALTAVPLPSFAERLLVDRFTGLLIWVSEAAAHLQGLPVLRIGTALVSSDGVLNITEGCSGILSFQGLAMISLFCGEWFRLSVVRRIAVLAGGTVFALGCNAVRSVILIWIYFHDGADSFNAFHDRVGSATYAVSMILTAALAWGLQTTGRGRNGNEDRPAHGGKVRRAGAAVGML